MAKVTSSFDGDAFRRQLIPKVERQMHKAVLVCSREAQRLVTQKVSQSVGTPGGGRRWVSGSSPGEPPYKFTGDLSRSFITNVESDDEKVVGIVGNTKRHGRHLELGTRKMAPRPYLRPAVTAMRRQVIKLLAEAFT